MMAREWRENEMPDISDIQTCDQLRPRVSLTINLSQDNPGSTLSEINEERIQRPESQLLDPEQGQKKSSIEKLERVN